MSTYNTGSIAQEVKAGHIPTGYEFETHQGFCMIDLYKDFKKLNPFYRHFFFI